MILLRDVFKTNSLIVSDFVADCVSAVVADFISGLDFVADFVSGLDFVADFDSGLDFVADVVSHCI